MFGSKLSMQLIPSQCHGRNLRAILKRSSWDTLSKGIRDHAKVCEHCGEPAKHCHEVWEWVISEGKLIQRLIGLEAVCVECHDFMHLGRLTRMGERGHERINVVCRHAEKVFGCDVDVLMQYISSCFITHNAISSIPVSDRMDLSWICTLPVGSVFGIDVKVWNLIWYEIYQYINSDEQEYHKEKNAGITD